MNEVSNLICQYKGENVYIKNSFEKGPKNKKFVCKIWNRQTCRQVLNIIEEVILFIQWRAYQKKAKRKYQYLFIFIELK